MITPQPVEGLELQRLEEMPVGDAQLPDTRPPWLFSLCPLRNAFRGCGLRIDLGEGQYSFWKILYCKQKPYECHCVQLRPSGPLQPDPGSRHAASDEAFLSTAKHVFEFDIKSLMKQGNLPVASVGRVSVLPDLVFRAPKYCASNQDWHPLQDYIDGQDSSNAGPAADSAERGRRPRQDTAEDELLAQRPGLAALRGSCPPHE